MVVVFRFRPRIEATAKAFYPGILEILLVSTSVRTFRSGRRNSMVALRYSLAYSRPTITITGMVSTPSSTADVHLTCSLEILRRASYLWYEGTTGGSTEV